MTTQRTIEERILRLEVLRGLEDPPSEWLPQGNMDALRSIGIGQGDAKKMLISNYGELPAEIRRRMERAARRPAQANSLSMSSK